MAPTAPQEEFQSHTQKNPRDTNQLHIFHVGTGMEAAEIPGRCQLHLQAQAEGLSSHSTMWDPVQDCLHVKETTGTNSYLLSAINFRSKN